MSCWVFAKAHVVSSKLALPLLEIYTPPSCCIASMPSSISNPHTVGDTMQSKCTKRPHTDTLTKQDDLHSAISPFIIVTLVCESLTFSLQAYEGDKTDLEQPLSNKARPTRSPICTVSVGSCAYLEGKPLAQQSLVSLSRFFAGVFACDSE